MSEDEKESAWWGLWRSSGMLVMALVGVAFVGMFLAFCATAIYELAHYVSGPDFSWGDVTPSAVVALGMAAYILGLLGWRWGKDVLEFLGTAAPVVVQNARGVVDEVGQRREHEREREERRDAQGGALSMSEGGEGGELSEVVFADGGLEELGEAGVSPGSERVAAARGAKK